jgi:hypothetical protein
MDVRCSRDSTLRGCNGWKCQAELPFQMPGQDRPYRNSHLAFGLSAFDSDLVCSAVIDTSLGDREISRHSVPARIMILQRDPMPFGEGLELV